jgi:hypothetical protein
MAPYPSTEETTRLLEFFAAFGIPTENMTASPGIQLDGVVLRLPLSSCGGSRI